jgi:hypothetical protein
VLDKWAQYYDAEFLDERISSELFEVFSGKLIITFEASRSLLRYLDQIGSVYLNFRVGPLRFGTDLVMIVQTNDPNLERFLKFFRLDNGFVASQCDALRATMVASTRAFQAPSLVFLGQVPGDASLICDGRFASVAALNREDFSRFAPDHIYHKPHPIDGNETETQNWLQLFPTSQLLDMPTYGLFCSHGDMEFVTVSSGSGYEAQLLGHDCTFVSRHNWGGTSPRWQNFTPILHEYWHSAFWQGVFGALDGHTVDATKAAEMRAKMAFAPERLRDAIAANWAQRWH